MKEKMNENIKKLMNDIVFYNLNHNEKIKDIILAEKNIMKCLDPEKIWNTEYSKKPYNILYNLEKIINEKDILKVDRDTLKYIHLKKFFKNDTLDFVADNIYQDKKLSADSFVINKILFDSGKNFFKILKDMYDLKQMDSKHHNSFNDYWFKSIKNSDPEYKEIYNNLIKEKNILEINHFIDYQKDLEYKFNKFSDIDPMLLSRDTRDFIRSCEDVRLEFPHFVNSYLSNIKEISFKYDENKTYECSEYYLDSFENIGIQEVVNFINEEYDFYKELDSTILYNERLKEISENKKAFYDFKYNDHDHPAPSDNYF